MAIFRDPQILLLICDPEVEYMKRGDESRGSFLPLAQRPLIILFICYMWLCVLLYLLHTVWLKVSMPMELIHRLSKPLN